MQKIELARDLPRLAGFKKFLSGAYDVVVRDDCRTLVDGKEDNGLMNTLWKLYVLSGAL